MKGMVDSFNVSVAAGILMHQAVCDRTARLVITAIPLLSFKLIWIWWTNTFRKLRYQHNIKWINIYIGAGNIQVLANFSENSKLKRLLSISCQSAVFRAYFCQNVLNCWMLPLNMLFCSQVKHDASFNEIDNMAVSPLFLLKKENLLTSYCRIVFSLLGVSSAGFSWWPHIRRKPYSSCWVLSSS